MRKEIGLSRRFYILLFLYIFYAYSTADATEMRTVIDPLDRQMNVPISLQRVVALAPSVTEIVYALEKQDLLKGVTRFSDYPPESANLPKVGSYVQLDVERIVALQPDVCIGIKDGNPLTTVAQLESVGIPVFAVNPVDFETIMQSIEAVGELLNAAAKAHVIVADMQRRIRQVKSVVAKVTQKPSVFVQIGVSPIVSVGDGTFIDQLITLAGGVNVAAGPNAYPRFSREQVIALAPDVLVIASMARQTVFEQVKSEWMQWPAIPAVRHQNVFIAPTNLFDRPTPRLVDGLEQMVRYVHPQLFKERP